MASIKQILLPVICLVIAECHVLDPTKPNFGLPRLKLPHFPKRHRDKHNIFDFLEPSVSIKDSLNPRPMNGDIFSYNSEQDYNRMFQNGFNRDETPFSGNRPFGDSNFDNMPLGTGFGSSDMARPFNYHNGNQPHLENIMNDNEKPEGIPNRNSGEKNRNEKMKPSGINDKPNLESIQDNKPNLPISTENVQKVTRDASNDRMNNPQGSEVNRNSDLNPKKDYLLVENNGSNVYLLHTNTPISGIPNNNQPLGNNVVVVPFNPQQPNNNQVYQVVNGATVSSNIPLTPDRVNSNGINSPVQSNIPLNSNLPSNNNNPNGYVMIYVNGQTIQIPGYIVNQPNNMPIQNGNPGPNLVVLNTVPNSNIQNVPITQNPPNIMYGNANQGNNQIIAQVPNNLAPASTVPNSGVVIQNLQPITVPQSNNIANVQPNMVPNYQQLVNSLPLNSANANEGVASAVVFPGNTNANNYQPATTQHKDSAVASPPSNDVPTENRHDNSSSVTQVPITMNGRSGDESTDLGARPAVMVSGFKELNKKEKDNSKEKMDKKDKSRKKDKKRK